MSKPKMFRGYALYRRDGGWAVYPPDSGSALPGLCRDLEAAKDRAAADLADNPST